MLCDPIRNERYLATGFNDGFQRCSKIIKRFEDWSATPDQFVIIRMGMNSFEDVEDDSVVNQCLDLIVKIEKELAA